MIGSGSLFGHDEGTKSGPSVKCTFSLLSLLLFFFCPCRCHNLRQVDQLQLLTNERINVLAAVVLMTLVNMFLIGRLCKQQLEKERVVVIIVVLL